MSYSILYNTQFVKSTAGISPAILVGDNNVWEQHWSGSRITERRGRRWNLFGNMLGVPGEQVIAKADSYTGGAYEEHWMKNGKWVNDAGLMRWVKDSVKNAATVEEIIAANPYCHIECKLIIWGGMDGHSRREEMLRYVYTTDDLDTWIMDVRLRTQEVMSAEPKAKLYPVIRFSTEKLAHPKQQGKKPAKVIIKYRHGYVVQIEERENGNRSIHYSLKASDALEMDYDDAAAILKRFSTFFQGTGRLVNSKAKYANPTTAICLSNGSYVIKFTGKTIRFGSKSQAKLYANEKAAMRTIEKMQNILDYNQLSAKAVSILETS